LGEFASEVKNAGGRLPGSNRVNPGKLSLDDEITITDSVAAQLGL
jgi:(2R)-3-sulfolactate dehydrogenase (NADP+)